jgi:SAM-dependent methyltransferase
MNELGQFDYRQRFYDNYVFHRKRRNKFAYSLQDCENWACATKSRVMDWLPEDRDTPVLDLGCGPGYFLYLLDKLGYTNLTGVDSISEQVSLARQFCPRATIIQDDLRRILAQNPGRFGLISGFDIIEHFSKDEVLPLLHLVAQALFAGGRIILQTPNAESPWVGNIAYGDFTHQWFFTPFSLATLLYQVGLKRFIARPCSPYVHGIKSFVRAVFWNLLNLTMTMINLIELGHKSSGIFTRVFVASAVKEIPYP